MLPVSSLLSLCPILTPRAFIRVLQFEMEIDIPCIPQRSVLFPNQSWLSILYKQSMLPLEDRQAQSL